MARWLRAGKAQDNWQELAKEPFETRVTTDLVLTREEIEANAEMLKYLQLTKDITASVDAADIHAVAEAVEAGLEQLRHRRRADLGGASFTEILQTLRKENP